MILVNYLKWIMALLKANTISVTDNYYLLLKIVKSDQQQLKLTSD